MGTKSLAEEEELLHKLRHKTLADIFGYLEIGEDTSLLDGHFTSKELRRIADAMDIYTEYYHRTE